VPKSVPPCQLLVRAAVRLVAIDVVLVKYYWRWRRTIMALV
jgi:hypothetical protein